MKTVIRPNMMWGALDSVDTFSRLNLEEEDAHINAIAKYNVGMFLVIKPETNLKTITLNYKVHYPNVALNSVKSLIQSIIQKVGIYTVLKTKGVWKNIDSQSLFTQSFGIQNTNLADQVITIQHDVSKYKNISEIQFCLPSLGYLKYLEINTDVNHTIKMPTKLNTIFLGSSIGSFNFIAAPSSLPCYLYRAYGINTCTTAIPKAHTFQCPKFMERLFKSYPETDKIVVDLENLKYDDFENSLEYIPKLDCFIFKPSFVHKAVDHLIKLGNIKYVLEANADMCCDWGHPNSYGIILYTDWLITNGKLKRK